MFCNNCGARVEEGTQFCGSCGSRVNVEQPVPVPEQPAVTEEYRDEKTVSEFEQPANDLTNGEMPESQPAVVEPAEYSPQPVVTESQEYQPQPVSAYNSAGYGSFIGNILSNKKWLIAIGGGALLLILIIVIGAVLIFGGGADTPEEAAEIYCEALVDGDVDALMEVLPYEDKYCEPYATMRIASFKLYMLDDNIRNFEFVQIRDKELVDRYEFENYEEYNYDFKGRVTDAVKLELKFEYVEDGETETDSYYMTVVEIDREWYVLYGF